MCNSSDCKICLVKIFFPSLLNNASVREVLKMDSKYLCSTRRNFSQLLRSNSRGALARAPGEAAFCAGKGCAGTGHCYSCSPEALRSRALYSQYSVARKGHGALLDLPILAGKTGFSPSATQVLHWCVGLWKDQAWLLNFPSSQARERGRIRSGGGSWAAFCFLFLVLELYLEVFQGRFFVFVMVS